MKALRPIAFLLATVWAPLSAQPPQHHVVLVIIDGARYSETLGDPAGQYTPRMHELAAVGAVVDTFLNDSLTYTQRAIPAIWCGTWVAPADTTIDTVTTQYARVPTLWEYFRKDQRRDSTDALYELKTLTAPWLPSFHPQYGPAYWPWYDMHQWSDLYVWRDARLRLAAFHPSLTVLYLADVDHAGHSGNWQDYTRAITIADSIVGMLWDFVQGDPVYRGSTTILVTNDHGRHSDGVGTGFVGHGDGCAGCRRIELLAVGSGVRHVRSATRRRIPDITPTIGALLGYSSPYSTGSAMTELLRPIMTCTPDSIDFGSVPLYQTAAESLNVYNSGGVDLHVTFSASPPFTVNPTTATIAPRQGRGFRVTFTPASPDPVSGMVMIAHDGGAVAETICVSGRGSPEATVSIPMAARWNLVSLPVSTGDARVETNFPAAVSPAFCFRQPGGYTEADTLVRGTGYWIRYPAEDTVSISGGIRLVDTVAVGAGWNLIGTPTFPADPDSVVVIPPGLISTPFYGYSGTYLQADSLLPGRGYWVKVSGNGKIILR